MRNFFSDVCRNVLSIAIYSFVMAELWTGILSAQRKVTKKFIAETILPPPNHSPKLAFISTVNVKPICLNALIFS